MRCTPHSRRRWRSSSATLIAMAAVLSRFALPDVNYPLGERRYPNFPIPVTGTTSDNDMKIDSLEALVFRIPTDQPESDGTLTWTATTVVAARASAAGTTGLGWTYGAAACAALVRDELAEAVVGADALDVGGIFSAMVDGVRNVGRLGPTSMALAAMETALWDLKARLLDLPLVRLLGQVHDEVAVYGSGGFTSYTDDELATQLGGWVEAGIPRVKLKVGTAWGSREERDVERVAVARGAIGPNAELYVDANGAYGRKQAVRLANGFADIGGVTWFEEPVSSDDLRGLHEIREQVTADVAAGEYGNDLFYFRRMCEAGAVDVL